MRGSAKAVFLSYASQDAEAAQRICDALRAAGIEVWFDQNDLVGGDAWDQKLRKQIKECALLIPIISANTQARTEGYFRLEWRLADQRTHLMAKGRPFLLPVVIDGTPDTDAHVPDSFTEVQWTKAPDGEVPAAFVARTKRLLSGEVSSAPRTTIISTAANSAGAPSRRLGRMSFAFVAVVGIGLVAYFGLRPTKMPAVAAADSPATPETNPALAPEAGPRAEARKIIDQVRAQLSPDEPYRAELELADDLCKRAADYDPASPDVWATWSQVDAWFVYQNLDNSATRRESARAKAERALRLDARSYEVRLAQACSMVRRSANALELRVEPNVAQVAEQALRTLARERPKDPRPLHALGILLQRIGRNAEAAGIFDQMATLPGSAAVAFNEKSWGYFMSGELRLAEEANAASLSIKPFFGNLLGRVQLSLKWTGDFVAARTAINQIPPSMQVEPLVLSGLIDLYWATRDSSAMLQLLHRVPQSWISSNEFSGPRHYYVGVAHEIAGNQDAARLAWAEALRVVELQLAREPGSVEMLFWKAGLLAKLGRQNEAEVSARLAESIAGDSDLHVLIALGDKDRALTRLEKKSSMGTREWTWAELKFDPQLEGLRKEPRFQALLARAAADPKRNPHVKVPPEKSSGTPPALVDDKSIAVLPFENRSSEKDNAYFADGVHEDILTSLAKVRGLKVISRTSVMRYRGTEKPIREIARELGVAFVLEGSVQRIGHKVHVTGQLIRAATDEHVWADAFDRELTDVFEIQRSVAQEIARALAASLSPEELREVATRYTTNLRAQELFLRARQMVPIDGTREQDEQRIREGVRLLEEAVRLDPEFVVAYVHLVRRQGNLLFNHYIPDADRPAQVDRARAALANVERLAPGSVQARLARGYFHYYAETDLDRGLAEFEAALKLEPNNDEVIFAIALIQRRKGRWAEAAANFETALRRDPLNRIAYDYGSVCYIQLQQPRKTDELLARGLAALSDDIDLAIRRTFNAAIELNDKSAMDRFLGSLPAGYDPDGKISRLRYAYILSRRDYSAAEAMLDNPESGLAAGLRKALGPGEPARTRAELAWLRHRPDEIRKHAQAAWAEIESSPSAARTLETEWVLATVQAFLGDLDKAQAHLQAYFVASEQGEDVSADLERWRRENFLQLYAGDYRGALDLLEKRLARRYGFTVQVVRWTPLYDCLKADPRFEAVMRSAEESQNK